MHLFPVPIDQALDLHQQKVDREKRGNPFVQHFRILGAGEGGDVQGEEGKGEDHGERGEGEHLSNHKEHLYMIVDFYLLL